MTTFAAHPASTRPASVVSPAARTLCFDVPADDVFDVFERVSALARRSQLRLIDLRIDTAGAVARVVMRVLAPEGRHGSVDPDAVGPVEVFAARLSGVVGVEALDEGAFGVDGATRLAAARWAA